MSSKRRSRRRTVVLLVGAAVVLVGAGVLVGRLVGDPDVGTSFAEAGGAGGPSSAVTTGASSTTGAPVVTGGPSAQPTGTGEATSVEPDRAPVTRAVSFTYADYDEAAAAVQVGAYVPELVETGGTCTVALTRSGASAQAQAQAVPDAVSTSCGELTIPLAELGSGSWDGVVTYDSATSTGRSADFVVVVP